MKLIKKKVILVSNITDHSGPTEGVASFLLSKCQQLLTIYHPFYYCQIKQSKIRHYLKGKLVEEKITRSYFLPEYLKYLVDQILTFYYVFRLRKKFDLFIGVNCLHALAGIIFRKLGVVKKVVFYSIDWMPRRFENPFINWLYFFVDKLSRTNSDYVWNLSEKITSIRKKQGLSNKKNIYVPNGVNFQEIKKLKKRQIQRNSLVLLGALLPDKGVDLVIKAMPLIWQQFPQVKLVVIGSTPKLNKIKNYEKIFEKFGKQVEVFGALSHQKVLSLLPQYGVGLAPYHPYKNNYSYYAWPARVIDYLACGLPVIITPVPSIAKKIALQKAGILINYKTKELVEAVKKLVNDDRFYWQVRNNTQNLVKDLSWNNILSKAFMKI